MPPSYMCSFFINGKAGTVYFVILCYRYYITSITSIRKIRISRRDRRDNRTLVLVTSKKFYRKNKKCKKIFLRKIEKNGRNPREILKFYFVQNLIYLNFSRKKRGKINESIC